MADTVTITVDHQAVLARIEMPQFAVSCATP